MNRKKVAVVQTLMVPGGGSEAVTAWAMEALKEEFEVTLVSFSPIEAEVLNHLYGTQLRKGQISMIQPTLPPLLNRTSRFSMLKGHLMMRQCKAMRDRFDLFISVGGTMDFGSPSIQYIALAAASTLARVMSRDSKAPLWYRFGKRAFMRFSEGVSGYSSERGSQNMTLVESNWTGELFKEIYGIPSFDVVYPPVNSPFVQEPWETKENGFLCIARITPGKLIDQAIEILQRVRDKGFDVSLRIIGRTDDPNYFSKLQHLARKNACWISLDGFITRQELVDLMDHHKYGINAANDEPFGIAVAEMVKAGAIVFVSNGGGQTEIVNSPQLIYDGIEDAVEKISRVLREESLQRDLLSKLKHQSSSFSTQAFCDGIRKAVDTFFSQREPV